MERDAIVLPPDVLRSLAREHLSGLEDLFTAPNIPARRLRGAAATHALALQQGEPIVLLYDVTLLAGGDIGFVATPARLCYRNHFEYPRSLRWDELARLQLTVRGGEIDLGRGKMTALMSEPAAKRVCAFLEACCRRRPPAATPYREISEARAPITFADLVVAAARRALGELEWVHYAPSIPARKARAARIAHARHLAPEREILVLYDDTVFGAGNDGFLFTEQGLCWRNFWSTAESMRWSEIEAERITTDGELLLLTGDPEDERRRIDLRMRPGLVDLAAAAVREIASAARAGRGFATKIG